MTCLKKKFFKFLIAQNHAKSSKNYLHPTLPLTRDYILSKKKRTKINLALTDSEDD